MTYLETVERNMLKSYLKGYQSTLVDSVAVFEPRNKDWLKGYLQTLGKGYCVKEKSFYNTYENRYQTYWKFNLVEVY